MGKLIAIRTTPRADRPSSRPSGGRRPPESAAAGAAAPNHSEARRIDAHAEPVRLAAEVARLEAELAAARERIVELEAHAERDPLTGVMNRRGFERELKRAAAYLRRYGGNAALVYLDLDGFKPLNDRHGHAAGDAMLEAVAAALVGSVRASDTVGRIGGDEFVVLLWNLSAADAHAKAEALERAIAARSVAWHGQALVVGATAGVAELSAHAAVEGLLSCADAAMYARKRAKRANRE